MRHKQQERLPNNNIAKNKKEWKKGWCQREHLKVGAHERAPTTKPRARENQRTWWCAQVYVCVGMAFVRSAINIQSPLTNQLK